MNACKIEKKTKTGKNNESTHLHVVDGSSYMGKLSHGPGGPLSAFYSIGPVLRLKPMVQAKLTIGKPNDKYEHEADRVADQVMRMPEPKQSLVNSHSSLVQRKPGCPDCMEQESEPIQSKPIADQVTSLVQRQEEEEEVPIQRAGFAKWRKPVNKISYASNSFKKKFHKLSKSFNSFDFRLFFAGSPIMKKKPPGLNFINKKSAVKPLAGFVGGWTGIRGPGAFTFPFFNTKKIAIKKGQKYEHFAEVLPTKSKDAVHECYYPGPGYHERKFSSGSKQVIKGVTYTHYFDVSKTISNLIKKGEQEHLNDALRAYNLTYKLIADRINNMKGKRFGPASSPYEADKLATKELKRKLPKQLGTSYKKWAKVLGTLLEMSITRDKKGWHNLDIDPSKMKGKRIIWPISKSNSTAIEKYPSTNIINYPP